MYSDRRKNIPKTAVPSISPMTFAPVSVRRRKMPSGRAASGERISMTMNAIERTAQPTRERIVSADVQPTVGARGEAVDKEHQRRRDGDRAGGVEMPLQAVRAALADDPRDEDQGAAARSGR